ncbi:MAG TPA: SUMF1/EgtB/PvdO family nonheme iron enzyme [Chitinophagaceae bacterium]|nr:SUMF1/EgtB/PvdO family nonheme iron enzyme [Chitinophagaceae bacterium]
MISRLACIFFLYIPLALSAQNDVSFAPYALQIPGSELEYKMVPIQGGSFKMGSAATEKNRKADEGPQKQITVSPFWMGAFEVTHDQFGVFHKDESVSQGSKVDAVTRPTAQYIDLSWNMGKDGGFPVNSMSQDAAMMFCRWLYDKTGIFYRLPTEAEWEYACRAGSQTAYFFGNDPAQLSQYAWFKTNSSNKYQKVGLKKPNPWGLYDMLGNVSEWTLDQYSDKYFDTVDANDPLVKPGSRYPRSIRGGSYMDEAAVLRSAARRHSEADWNIRDPQYPKSRWWLTDGMFVGFRVVRPLKQPSKEEAENFYKLYLGK